MAHLRPAHPTDAGATGEILFRFQQDTPWMPKLYSEVENIAFCGAMIDRGWVTVAEEEGRIVGFLARDGEEICALYMLREVNGKGIGAALLDAAKGQCQRLTLKAFQDNTGARKFYKREGFVELRRGDGSGNEENLPDVEFLWTARPSVKPAEKPTMKPTGKPAGKPKPKEAKA